MRGITAESLRSYEHSPINRFTGLKNTPEHLAFLDQRDQDTPERNPSTLRRILLQLSDNEHVIFGGKTSLGQAAQIAQFVYWQINHTISFIDRQCYTKVMVITSTRSAATGLAAKLKMELGTTAKRDVLTRMRDGDRRHQSKFVVTTEGMALRAIMDDPRMSGFAAIIFLLDDPSPTLELMMAWSRYVRSQSSSIRFIFLSPPTDYRVLARTHNLPLCCLLQTPTPVSQPVIRYLPTPRQDQPKWVVEEVIYYLRSGILGDILVYVPGYKEAQEISERIRRDEAMGVFPPVEIHLISADVEEGAKFKAIEHRTEPHPRRLICTTHILPTHDVNIILDGLTQRSANYDPFLNRDAISLSRISAAQANQRMGNVGYVSRDGKPEAIPRSKTEDYQELLLYNLALTRKMRRWYRIPDGVKVLPTANQPSLAIVLRAVDTLESVGVIDRNDETGEFCISNMGRDLADLPVLVEFGRALMASKELGVESEMIILVAAVSTSKALLLPRPRNLAPQHDHAIWDRRDALMLGAGDHLDCYNAFREFRRLCQTLGQGETSVDVARKLGLNHHACREALSICGSLRYRLHKDYESDNLELAGDREVWDPAFVAKLHQGIHNPWVIEQIQRSLLAGHLGKVALLLNVRAWSANTQPRGTPNVPLNRRREVTHMRWRDRSTTLVIKPFTTPAPVNTAPQVIYTDAELDHSSGLTAIKMVTPFRREWLDEECQKRTHERLNR